MTEDHIVVSFPRFPNQQWSIVHAMTFGCPDLLYFNRSRPLRDDVESLAKGLGVARNVFGQAAFEDIRGKEVFPGADVTEVGA